MRGLARENNHLLGDWMSSSFRNYRWGEVRKQSKKAINLANASENGKTQAGECVHFFLPVIHRLGKRVLNKGTLV